jgi:high-affinity iron transporter
MFLSRILACCALALAAVAQAAPAPRELLGALHMLDYIGVDYAGAVQDGAVISEAEYQEQREFAAEVSRTLERVQANAALRDQASALEQKIAARAATPEIQQSTAALTRALLATYPIATAPPRAPTVSAAPSLYEAQCASCHGREGRGDGIAAAGLEPPPANFRDAERNGQRSIFSLYNTISLGVAGTGMPSFAQLPDDSRWALAFFVSQLQYSDGQRHQGEQLWKKDKKTAAIDSLEQLTAVTAADLAQKMGADAEPLLAHLRAHPEVLEDRREPLAIASTKIKASVEAYRAGKVEEASQVAIAAYLDGFELAEAQLTTLDQPLMKRIEQAMMDFRGLLKAGSPVADVEAAAAQIEGLLGEARSRLLGGTQSAAGSFIGSFVILAREGLEAILVLAAMFAFLRKTDRRDAIPYLHGGWIAALALGVATWAASNWLVDISGAGREITEGFTALLAAAILLSVGFWLHGKSYSNRWQQYVAGRMRGALSGGRPWGLAFLAFIAVYREVFETVLFYRALWGQGDHVAIVLGVVVASAALLVLTWAIFAVSMRLPIREFFGWSSALIVVLAVVFTGKGVAALQEAGALAVDTVDFVRVPLLGIYPNLQGLALQSLVLALVLAGFGWNHLRARTAT